MKRHYGKIELGTIENIGENAHDIKLITAQFVHYPDYQQLTIWLPQYGREGYGAIRLIDNKTKKVLEENPVADKLNGSVQILWDTLGIAPSNYTIEIEHPKGGKHILPFKKMKPEAKKKPKAAEIKPPRATTAQNSSSSTTTQTYIDGFGQPIPNQDLTLREQLNAKLTTQYSRHIAYEGNFRAGYVIYVEDDVRLKFSHEMGGGNCKFYIDIPNENTWEAATMTPLSRRSDIVDFIAHTVQSNQASSWQFEIREDCIYYY